MASALVSSYAQATKAVRAARQSGQKPVAHAEGAGLQVAEDRARSRLDALGPELQLFQRRRGERHIYGDVECLVLARRKTPLQVLRVRQGPGQGRVRGPDALLEKPVGPHTYQLALQVVHHPGYGQRDRVPGKPEVQTRRKQAVEPARLQVGARQPVDAPGAIESARIQQSVRELAAVYRTMNRGTYLEADPHLADGATQPRSLGLGRDETGREAVRRRRARNPLGESNIRSAHACELDRHHARRRPRPVRALTARESRPAAAHRAHPAGGGTH